MYLTVILSYYSNVQNKTREKIIFIVARVIRDSSDSNPRFYIVTWKRGLELEESRIRALEVNVNILYEHACTYNILH